MVGGVVQTGFDGGDGGTGIGAYGACAATGGTSDRGATDGVAARAPGLNICVNSPAGAAGSAIGGIGAAGAGGGSGAGVRGAATRWFSHATK